MRDSCPWEPRYISAVLRAGAFQQTYLRREGIDEPGEKLEGFIILCLDDLLLKSMSKCGQILLFT